MDLRICQELMMKNVGAPLAAPANLNQCRFLNQMLVFEPNVGFSTNVGF